MIYLRMGYIYKILVKRFCLRISYKFTNVRYFFRKTNMVPQYRPVGDPGVASATGKSDVT